MRLLLIVRAWPGAAALLHGFYDFPLFLGDARAGLYPTPINQFAAVFSMETPTMLSTIYLGAVVAVCIGAATSSFSALAGRRAREPLASGFVALDPVAGLVFATGSSSRARPGSRLADFCCSRPLIWIALPGDRGAAAGLLPVDDVRWR